MLTPPLEHLAIMAVGALGEVFAAGLVAFAPLAGNSAPRLQGRTRRDSRPILPAKPRAAGGIGVAVRRAASYRPFCLRGARRQ